MRYQSVAQYPQGKKSRLAAWLLVPSELLGLVCDQGVKQQQSSQAVLEDCTTAADMAQGQRSTAISRRHQQHLLQLLLALVACLAFAGAAAAAVGLNSIGSEDLALYMHSLHRNSTVLNTDLLDDPNLPTEYRSSSSSRHLLAQQAEQWAMYEQQGRYVQIQNPSMPDKHSSTGQVAIHSVLLPKSYKILLFGRNLPKSGLKSQPEPRIYGNVSVVYDVRAGDYSVAPNYETLFCTGHTIMSDGNVVAAGGDMGFGYSWMKEGRDVVRIFYPDSMKWETLPGVKLSEYRWYPTQTNLPDDRIIIVGGFLDDPARQTGKPAPSIDVFDYKSRNIVVRKSRYDLGKSFFTNLTPGYQLYPAVFLLNWLDPNKPDDWFLFMYTCKTGQVVRFTSDNNFIPMWNSPWPPIDNMCTAFSAMGSAAILPLRPSKGYEFEVAIFGGGTQGKGMDCKGVCNAPASKTVFRMKLPGVQDALKGNWPAGWVKAGDKLYEEMSLPRVFADAVLLPTGQIVVLNGAQKGVPGGGIDGGSTAKEGAYMAILYDPDKPANQRMTPLASSNIHRYYHSNALLLPSGDIWVAGSEQADCVDNCAEGGKAPPDQEYRAELLQLPYAFKERPVITSISSDTVQYGGQLTIQYDLSRKGGFINTVSVIPPGANTHSLNMMQRVVFLKVVKRNKEGDRPKYVTVQFPTSSDRVLNPGYYMLWINDADIPCKEAKWIKLVGK